MLKCRNSTKVLVPKIKLCFTFLIPMFMSAFPRKSYVRNRFYAFICIKMHINGSGEKI